MWQAGMALVLLASISAIHPAHLRAQAIGQVPGTPTGPVTPAASSLVDAARYIIGPGDTLNITIWREPTLSGAVPVRPDGMISMVLIGDLKAAGFTPMQLSTSIADKLKKFVQDPNVSVVVTGVDSQRVYLIGEVGHVGPINLVGGMSPLQAIAAAGGLSPFANTKRIYILRGQPGKQLKIPYNYKQALKGTAKRDIALEPGDTIVVP